MYIILICKLRFFCSILDLLDLSVGAGSGILRVVGIICVNRVIRMFKGDVMEQLFKLIVAGFVLIAVVGFSDVVLVTISQVVSSGVFAAALMVSFALLLIGLVRLIQWNEKSKLSGIA